MACTKYEGLNSWRKNLSVAPTTVPLLAPWTPDLFCHVAGSDVEAAQFLVIVILIVEVLQCL